jgi:hypothetical protein
VIVLFASIIDCFEVIEKINYGAAHGRVRASTKSNGINERYWRRVVFMPEFFGNAPKLRAEIGAGIKAFGQKKVTLILAYPGNEAVEAKERILTGFMVLPKLS